MRLLSISAVVLLVLLVGFSRIALGAHFLTDVLAAIFFGAVWLMLCLVGGKSLGKYRRHFADPLPVSPEVVPVPIDQSAQTIKVHHAS